MIELWRTPTTSAQRDLLAAARGLAEGRSMNGTQLSGDRSELRLPPRPCGWLPNCKQNLCMVSTMSDSLQLFFPTNQKSLAPQPC